MLAFLGHLTLFSGFSSLEENEVDESVDHGLMVAAAATGDPIFGLVTTTLCHEREGVSDRLCTGKGCTTGGRGRDPQS